MSTSTFAGNKLLDFLFRGIPWTPGRFYVSLHTGSPGLTGVNEVSVDDWPAYGRLDPADGGDLDEGFSAAVDRAIANLLQLEWPDHDGEDDITLTHAGIRDAATGGNFIYGTELTRPDPDNPGQRIAAHKTIHPHDQVVFRAGELIFEIE